MTASSKPCVVSALENPQLNDAMLGLQWQERELVIQPSIFPCCQGTGDIISATRTARCSLRERFIRAQKVTADFQRHWPDRDPRSYFEPSKSRQSTLLGEVAAMLKGNAPQAQVSRGHKGEPSPLWLKAMTAVWRFGFEAHVIHFPSQGRRALEALRNIHDSMPLIFVEQITRMWDAQKAYECEAIISFAYKTNACLWMEFIGGDEASPAPRRETMAQQAFSRRLERLAKNRSPISYLEPDSAGRLKYLTENPRLMHDTVGNDDNPVFDD